MALSSSSSSFLPANAVFEGGGVRGIAHVGALQIAEALGYRWQHVAGTSAGALVAALIAAGYTASEMYPVLSTLDYRRFADDLHGDRLHLLAGLQLLTRCGLHSGSYLEGFVRELLAARGIQTFGQLRVAGSEADPFLRYRLCVIASDITTGQLVRFPQDAALYGLDPDALDIAFAVRMSASIPFFFRPVRLTHASGATSLLVDGALLSNYPLFLFEPTKRSPAIPTFGFRLVDPTAVRPQPATNPFTLGKALLSTMLEAHDKLYMSDPDYVRTIAIPADGIAGTAFHLSSQQIQRLYANGQQAARRFFQSWSFAAYQATYGQERQPGSRQQLLHEEMLRRAETKG